MNDRDENFRPDCCEDSDCSCTSTSDGSNSGSGWKIVVFSVVILLAGAVAAYSLIWRSGDNSSGCVPGSAACAVSCAGLSAIPGLEQELAGYDFALVVLPSPEEGLPPDIASTVSAANIAINAKGVKARRLTLHPDDSVFATVADQFKIAEFPAVLALGKTSAVVLTQSGIHEDTILNVYNQSAEALRATCAPVDAQKK